MRLSESDAFSPTGNTPFVLGEGCRRQDMIQKVCCSYNSAFLSFSPDKKMYLHLSSASHMCNIVAVDEREVDCQKSRMTY